MRTLSLLAVVFLMALCQIEAQETMQPAPNTRSWDVFIEVHDDRPNQTDLIFADILSGETFTLHTIGERYTLLEDGVLYFDTRDRQVKLAKPNGTIRDHPFITMTPDAYRVDWAVSTDRQAIAWTLARKSSDSILTTSTFMADANGTEIRELLTDGPRTHVRVLPIALSDDKAELYMDVHPDGIDEYAPYVQYAGLFALNLASGEMRTLPGEPACFCAAGFGTGMFLRLRPNDESGGVDVQLDSLHGGAARVIPALSRQHDARAGGVLVSADNTLAVYALSQMRGYGTAEQAVRTVFMRVNLLTLEQSPLSKPITSFVQPLKWTEDNTAILFTSDRQNGTWKIILDSGQVVKVAAATYLGHLRQR